MIKQFVFGVLLLLVIGCQQAPEKVQKTRVVGVSSQKLDRIVFQNFSHAYTPPFFGAPILEDGSFKLEILLPGPIVTDARVYEGRQFKKSQPCFLEPGKIVELEIGESKMNYKGELKEINEFVFDFHSAITNHYYKYYNGVSLNDFNNIDSVFKETLSLLEDDRLDDRLKEFFSQVAKFNFDAIKYKSIIKSGLSKSEWPVEVSDFVKQSEQEHFSSMALMSIRDYTVVLEDYFSVLELYNPDNNNFKESIAKLQWIENAFVKEWYALHLSKQLVFRMEGLDGSAREEMEKFSEYIKMEFPKKIYAQLLVDLTNLEKEFDHLLPGKPAPKFNFENVKGEMISLEQFKGKYVLLDVWNIYCGPCILQIPYLKKYEKVLHDAPIEFVSITCDPQDEKSKWQNFVKEKEMVGHQLIMDDGRNSQFLADYALKGFPTFILIDPDGNMVDYKFLLPERPEFMEVLTSIMNK